MRLDVNAPKLHQLTMEYGGEKAAFNVWGLLTTERCFGSVLQPKPQFATVWLSMWKGALNNSNGNAIVVLCANQDWIIFWRKYVNIICKKKKWLPLRQYETLGVLIANGRKEPTQKCQGPAMGTGCDPFKGQWDHFLGRLKAEDSCEGGLGPAWPAWATIGLTRSRRSVPWCLPLLLCLAVSGHGDPFS